MSSFRFLTLTLISLAIAACGQATPTPPPSVGDAKSFSNACDKANDGKRIAVAGYLRFPESFTGSQSVVLRFYEDDNLAGAPIGVQIDFGTQANQVQAVTDQYTDADLKVYLADGQVAPFGTKVRVSGKAYFPLAKQDFACGLENPLVELAP
jgi:hypothetical protein